MFVNRPQILKEFKQLSLFDPKRFLERMNDVTSRGAFSLELESGETELREPHWIGDREVHTRVTYALNQGRLEVGDALFETGVIGRNPEKEEEPPYFESLVLRTNVPLAFRSGKTFPISTIKILLTQQPYSENVFSDRVDRTRFFGNWGWARDYTLRDLLPTSEIVNTKYADRIKLTETFNHHKPVA